MDPQPHQSQQEVDTQLSFRTGWPTLPTLPVKTSPQEHNLLTLLPDWKTNLALLGQILDENDVLVIDRFLCYRYNKGIPISERKPTFLIYSDLRGEGQHIEKWRKTAWAIHMMFQQRNLNNFVVEIVDQRVNEKIKTDIIHSDEREVLEAWSEIAPRIVQCLSDHKWTSLDLLHRRWFGAREDTKATVVISAADANDSIWWHQTLHTLRAILPNFLGIELIYLDSIFAVDRFASSESNQVADQDLEELAYTKPNSITMGASCGRKWAGKGPDLGSGSGTLGGLVRLDGHTHQFGLSNHHVFFKGMTLEFIS